MISIFNSSYRIAVAFFVTSVLVGQCVVTFAPLFGQSFGTKYWPIISYRMYSRAHYEGDTLYVYDLLEGAQSDGSVVEIPMERLGLGTWY